MTERHEWLRRQFGFKKSEIHLVAKKERVPGDFLVDDKPSHVGAWRETSKDAGYKGTGLLWHAPYNDGHEDIGRVEDWATVCDLVFRYQKALHLPGPYST